MICPHCLSDMPGEADACPECGVPLKLGQTLQRLAKQVTQIKEQCGNMNNLLSGLSTELAMAKEITRISFSPAKTSKVQEHREIKTETPVAQAVAPIKSPEHPDLRPPQKIAQPVEKRPVSIAASARPAKEHAVSEAKIGQKWLLIVGVVIMVLGIGYFLKYSPTCATATVVQESDILTVRLLTESF